MTYSRPLSIALVCTYLLMALGCASTPKVNALSPTRTAANPSALQYPIEMMQWGDPNLSCEQIKAKYDQLARLVKDAGRLIPLPNAPGEETGGTSAITFIPLLGPLIAMRMDSASRAQAAFEGADFDPAQQLQAATIAHQRGHEAIDRRQYLVYLASQKGCK